MKNATSRRWQSWRFNDATRYLVVGSQRVKDCPIVLDKKKIVQGQVKCYENLSSDKHEKHKYWQ